MCICAALLPCAVRCGTEDMASTSDSSASAAGSKPLHIRLAAPVYGCRVPGAFFVCVKQLQQACQASGVNLSVDLIGNESLVQRARNVLVERFMRSDADKIFFVDSDITFNPEDFLRIARNPKDVVTGAYAKKDVRWDDVERGVLEGRSEPVHSLGLNYNVNITQNTKACEDGTFEVLDAATGFMCLSRGVIKRLCDSFHDELLVNNDLPHVGDDSQHIKQYVAILDCMIDPDTKRYLSEDYALCRRLQQIGEKVWLDFQTTLSHEGTADYIGDARAVWETLRRARARIQPNRPQQQQQTAQTSTKPESGKPPRPGSRVESGAHQGASQPALASATITELSQDG